MANVKKVCIAGHFNPAHIGHINLIKGARKLGNYLIVVVCNDYQAKMKRPKVFLPAKERAKLMKEIKGVDEVVIAIDKTTHISKTLKKIKPHVFANGCNENHPDLIEEMKVCKKLGIRVALNVGGKKIRSSSTILKQYYD